MIRDLADLLETIEPPRDYDFETLALMTAVFDRLCGYLAPVVRNENEIRRKLASVIARHIDDERHFVRLSDLAFDELLGISGSPRYSRRSKATPKGICAHDIFPRG
jgi:hypothetical protein